MPAGKSGTRLKGEDSLEEVVSVNDHDNLLFFTAEGHAYAVHAYDIPQAARTATGTPITQVGLGWQVVFISKHYCFVMHLIAVQVLKVGKPSSIAAMLPVSQFSDDVDVVMLSANGLIKRTPLSQYAKITSRGVCAMRLKVRRFSHRKLAE